MASARTGAALAWGLCSASDVPYQSGGTLKQGLLANADLLLNIDVPEIAAGVRFYTAAFGLEVGLRLGAHVVELIGWPVKVYLLEKAPGTIGAGGEPRCYDRHWTAIHPDIVVADLAAAFDRAVAAGAAVERPPEDVAYGRIAMLADPFGHGFCLIEFNERGYGAML